MADKKISALTSASTPLAGTEVLPIVQSGSTVKVSVADLTAGRAVAASSVTVAGVVKIGPSPTDGINIFKFGTSSLASVVYGDTATGDIIITDPSGNGNFKLTAAGDVAISKAGRGIDFSANTHAAGMTSELLNDYEEGTWTPVPTTGTGTYTTITASGSYVKVGRIVCVSFDIVFNNIGTATECDTVQGLPYAAGAQSGSGAFREYTNQGDMWSTTVLPSTTEFITRTYANGKNVSNGDRFTGSFTYITA